MTDRDPHSTIAPAHRDGRTLPPGPYVAGELQAGRMHEIVAPSGPVCLVFDAPESIIRLIVTAPKIITAAVNVVEAGCDLEEPLKELEKWLKEGQFLGLPETLSSDGFYTVEADHKYDDDRTWLVYDQSNTKVGVWLDDEGPIRNMVVALNARR